MTEAERVPPSAAAWLIGRDGDCDVIVDESPVSGRHCRLTHTSAGFLIEDLGSKNGTYVNDVRIDGHTLVTRDDWITLGRTLPMPWPAGALESVKLPQTLLETGHGDRAITWKSDEEPTPLPAGAKVITVGRAADNQVVLDYPIISAHHARVVVAPGEMWLEDLNSMNGTAIGSPDNKIRRAKLSETDAVFFGSLRVLALRLLEGKLALGEQPCSTVAFLRKTIVLGRDPGCDEVLDDPRVSRRHAVITRAAEGGTVEDLGSEHGTYVNGQRIDGTATLRPGDLLAIGCFTFKWNFAGELERRDYRGNVTIEAREVTVDVKDRRLLEHISLTVYPSEFVGLMGPSGAGKTTLMNVLNGYTRPTSGEARFNQQELYADYQQFQGMIGYVPQDDIMHSDLTVGQALYYTARLRFPADATAGEIADKISTVLDQLGLMATRHVLIGSPQKKGISGGQRKRVNLAMELLTDPPVLFLDEPTSGLSSEDALNVMKLLRRLADGGKTVVLTIHQPGLEAYRLLDNLIVVAKDEGSPDPGQLVYYGPAYPQAIEFFNPAHAGKQLSPDDLLRGFKDTPTAEWCLRYETSHFRPMFVTDRAGTRPPSAAPAKTPPRRGNWGVLQWWTLVNRTMAVKAKDLANTTVLLAQAPIIGLLLAMVFGDEAAAAVTPENWHSVSSNMSTTVFLLALAALWFGCSNSAREIVAEWPIYRRERMINLKIPSYVASKFTVLGGLSALQCAVLLGIVHPFVGLRAPWLLMFGMLFLNAMVGLALGLTVSAMAKTSEVAIALLPLILLPMVILGGVLQPLHKLSRPTATLADAMPLRWAYEPLLLMEAGERDKWSPSPVPPMPSAADATPQRAPAPQPVDMAEVFFPQKSHRHSIQYGAAALGSIFGLLALAVLGILRFRDIH